MVVGGHLEMIGFMDIFLGDVCSKTTGMGKHGDGLTNRMLFLEFQGALSSKVGNGFFYIVQMI